ncbi:hypothetical protein ABIE89_000393 [Bradyrhizobium niftali]
MALWTCLCAWDNEKSVVHMATAEQQQMKKGLKSRFKIDNAPSPTPENKKRQNASRG